MTGSQVEELARTCAPALADLLSEAEGSQIGLPLFEAEPSQTQADLYEFAEPSDLEALPSRYRKAVEQAAILFRFLERKDSASFSPVFQPLLGPLDEAARGLILECLLPDLPATAPD